MYGSWLLGRFLQEASLKIHREIPVLESLSDTVKCLQIVRLAALLKTDPALVFQNQPFIDLQNRCS